jgi:hypothetical protein
VFFPGIPLLGGENNKDTIIPYITDNTLLGIIGKT